MENPQAPQAPAPEKEHAAEKSLHQKALEGARKFFSWLAAAALGWLALILRPTFALFAAGLVGMANITWNLVGGFFGVLAEFFMTVIRNFVRGTIAWLLEIVSDIYQGLVFFFAGLVSVAMIFWKLLVYGVCVVAELVNAAWRFIVEGFAWFVEAFMLLRYPIAFIVAGFFEIVNFLRWGLVVLLTPVVELLMIVWQAMAVGIAAFIEFLANVGVYVSAFLVGLIAEGVVFGRMLLSYAVGVALEVLNFFRLIVGPILGVVSEVAHIVWHMAWAAFSVGVELVHDVFRYGLAGLVSFVLGVVNFAWKFFSFACQGGAWLVTALLVGFDRADRARQTVGRSLPSAFGLLEAFQKGWNWVVGKYSLGDTARSLWDAGKVKNYTLGKGFFDAFDAVVEDYQLGGAYRWGRGKVGRTEATSPVKFLRKVLILSQIIIPPVRFSKKYAELWLEKLTVLALQARNFTKLVHAIRS